MLLCGGSRWLTALMTSWPSTPPTMAHAGDTSANTLRSAESGTRLDGTPQSSMMEVRRSSKVAISFSRFSGAGSRPFSERNRRRAERKTNNFNYRKYCTSITMVSPIRLCCDAEGGGEGKEMWRRKLPSYSDPVTKHCYKEHFNCEWRSFTRAILKVTRKVPLWNVEQIYYTHFFLYKNMI